MKKIIFKFWVINLLISSVLFVAYRMVIANTNRTTYDMNLLDKIIDIFEGLLNLGFSIIYFVVMVFCSLLIFFNLIKKIRKNYFLSFLTSLGIPLISVIFFNVSVLMRFHLRCGSILATFMIFSTLYLLFTTIAFLIFRKKIKSYELSE
jgi:hypothetical protein